MNPRLSSCRSSSASSNLPAFISTNTLMIPIRITTLMAAMTYRNVPDTVVPIQPVMLCSRELSFFTDPSSERTPIEIKNASANTTVE